MKRRWGGRALRSSAFTERPFRTVPGGILRKFFRRLSQFPPSFLAQSRWAPRSSGEFRSGLCHPAKEIHNPNKK